jgi:SEC-C motif-containing protein
MFDDCCGSILAGAPAPTALVLMRSRYSAFVTHDADYLLQSWHPDQRPASVEFDPQQRWLGLKIKSIQSGGIGDAEGTVEFVARYKIDGKAHRLHETSRFVRLDNYWVYMDGDHQAPIA